jgi:hypothetical protein
LIPAGTGYGLVKNLRLIPLAEPVEQPKIEVEKVAEEPVEEEAE